MDLNDQFAPAQLMELRKQAEQLFTEEQRMLANLLAITRAIEPALRDGNQHHMADRLGAALDAYDRHIATRREWMKSNREAAVILALLNL